MRQLGVLAMLLALSLAARGEANRYVPIPQGTLSSVLSSGRGDRAPIRIAAFSMRQSPVTVAEFMQFTRTHPDWQRGQVPSIFAGDNYLAQYALGGDQRSDQAVTSVSWFAAQAYCESEGARLPNWYEWEYVAAADETRADARADPKWRAAILNWYAQSPAKTASRVGGMPNYFGVRDMHGLIWEWVDDFNALLVSADSRTQGDPDQLQFCGAGAISLQDRDNFAVLMRVALLSSLNGADSTTHLGFRCAREIGRK